MRRRRVYLNDGSSGSSGSSNRSAATSFLGIDDANDVPASKPCAKSMLLLLLLTSLFCFNNITNRLCVVSSFSLQLVIVKKSIYGCHPNVETKHCYGRYNSNKNTNLQYLVSDVSRRHPVAVVVDLLPRRRRDTICVLNMHHHHQSPNGNIRRENDDDDCKNTIINSQRKTLRFTDTAMTSIFQKYSHRWNLVKLSVIIGVAATTTMLVSSGPQHAVVNGATIPSISIAPTTVVNVSPTPATSALVVTNPQRESSIAVRSSNNNSETISGLVAGAALTVTKTIVKYPMDTATVRLQMPPNNSNNSTQYTIYKPFQLFHNAYIGIIPPLLSNIPAGAVFFAVKDTVSSTLQSIATTTTTIVVPNDIAIADAVSSSSSSYLHSLVVYIQYLCLTSRTFRTCIAVAVAQIPYWIVRNPSEVMKTKQQAADIIVVDRNAINKATNIIAVTESNKNKNYNVNETTTTDPNTGAITTTNTSTTLWNQILGRYYTGYWENVLYAYPADVLKFVCYEQLSSHHYLLLTTTAIGSSHLPSGAIESALYGAIATTLAQYLTTPLDVVRNRVMAASSAAVVVNGIAVSNNVAFSSATLSAANASNTKRTETISDTAMTDTTIIPPFSSISMHSSFLTTYATSIILLGQEEGYNGLFAGATPRILKAFISGAIQFVTYEETKQALIKFLTHK